MHAAIEARPPKAFVRHAMEASYHAADASYLAFPGGLRFDFVRDAVAAARTARSAASTALERVAPAGALDAALKGQTKLKSGIIELLPFATKRFEYPNIPDGLDRALVAANSHFRLAGYLFEDAIDAAQA